MCTWCDPNPALSAAAPSRLEPAELEDPEVAAEHGDRDVVDRHAVDGALEGTRVRVAVEHHVGFVLSDRCSEAVVAEHGPDRLGLAAQGLVVGA